MENEKGTVVLMKTTSLIFLVGSIVVCFVLYYLLTKDSTNSSIWNTILTLFVVPTIIAIIIFLLQLLIFRDPLRSYQKVLDSFGNKLESYKSYTKELDSYETKFRRIHENLDNLITIKECDEDGIDNINDSQLDKSKPVMILTPILALHHLPPAIRNKSAEFKKGIKIVLDLSKKTLNARAIATSIDEYYDGGWSRTEYAFESLKRGQSDNIEIFVANKLQYPVGMMIINGSNTFYAPLWNHNIKKIKKDSFKGVYLQVDSNSKFGIELSNSFNKLLVTGKKIPNFNMKILKEYYADEYSLTKL